MSYSNVCKYKNDTFCTVPNFVLQFVIHILTLSLGKFNLLLNAYAQFICNTHKMFQQLCMNSSESSNFWVIYHNPKNVLPLKWSNDLMFSGNGERIFLIVGIISFHLFFLNLLSVYGQEESCFARKKSGKERELERNKRYLHKVNQMVYRDVYGNSIFDDRIFCLFSSWKIYIDSWKNGADRRWENDLTTEKNEYEILLKKLNRE